MLKAIITKLVSFFDFDLRVKNIVHTGIKLCFILTLFSVFIMSLYITVNHSYLLYNLGLGLFRASTNFISVFLVCGIAFSKIVKDKI